jgi:hypothetical protein
MQLEIISTTDGRFIGRTIDTDPRPIVLDATDVFWPDRIWQIGPGLWRLANSSYIIDGTE